MELINFDWPWSQEGYAFESRGGVEFIVPVGPTVLVDPRRYSLSIFRNFVEKKPSGDWALEFSNRFGLLLDGDQLPLSVWLKYQKLMKEVWEAGKSGDWIGLSLGYNDKSTGAVSTQLMVDNDDWSKTQLVLEPSSLLQMMWLEMVLHLTNASGLRPCDWCGLWFPYGKGTNRRETAKFCSNKCRKANFMAAK